MVLFLATILGALVAILPMLSAFVVSVLLPSGLTTLLAVVCGGLVVLGLFQTVFTWFDTMIMTTSIIGLLWHPTQPCGIACLISPPGAQTIRRGRHRDENEQSSRHAGFSEPLPSLGHHVLSNLQ